MWPMNFGIQREGKDVLIIDDMISSGESVLDVAKELKRRRQVRSLYVLLLDSLQAVSANLMSTTKRVSLTGS